MMEQILLNISPDCLNRVIGKTATPSIGVLWNHSQEQSEHQEYSAVHKAVPRQYKSGKLSLSETYKLT